MQCKHINKLYLCSTKREWDWTFSNHSLCFVLPIFGFSWHFNENGVELLYRNKNQQNRFYQCDLHLTNHKPTAYIVFRRVLFFCSASVLQAGKKWTVVKVLVYNILRAQVTNIFSLLFPFPYIWRSFHVLCVLVFIHFIVICNIFHGNA